MTPTVSVSQIDLAANGKETMMFGSGVNVVAVGTRMLIESKSHLTIRAPAGAEVIFQIGTLFTTQFGAKVSLAGGIKASSVAYVVGTNVTLGSGSSVLGTMFATSGTCMLDASAKLTGALICGSGVSFSGGSKLTFVPLASTFP